MSDCTKMIISNINRRFEVPWPLTGMGQVHNRVAESATLINGEQYVYRAPVPFRSYNMSWAGGVEGVQPVLDLFDGVYGKGPFYITEPLATLTGKNLLPPQWASCYMLADMANGWGSPQVGSGVRGYISRTNLCTNPSATSTAGFAVSAGTSGTASGAVVSSGGLYGPSFYRETWSVASTGGSPGIQYQENVSGASGDVRSASLWVRASAARNVNLLLRFRTGTSTVTNGQGPTVAVPANTWTEIKCENVVASGSYDNIFLWALPVSPGYTFNIGETFDVDGVMLEDAPSVGQYFDGSFTATANKTYAWTGTANASDSTETVYTAPSDNYVQFTGKAGASTKFPYPVTVPVVPGQQYFFTAWGGASAGATAGVLVSMFDRKAGAWSRTITYTLSAAPTASVRVFTVPELQADDITVLRITPFINTVGGTMWLWAMDLSTTDIFADGEPLPVRTGRGVGALQFTGNISGNLISAKIDRAGFSVDMAEVRPPLTS